MTTNLQLVKGEPPAKESAQRNCDRALLNLDRSSRLIRKRLECLMKSQENIQLLIGDRALSGHLESLSSSQDLEEIKKVAGAIEKVTDMLATQSIIAISEVQELTRGVQYQDRVLMDSISNIMEEIVKTAGQRKTTKQVEIS